MNNHNEHINTVYFLQQLAVIFERHCDQVFMERLGIGFAQYKILNVMSDSKTFKQNELASALHQTEASISRQINILKKVGLVLISANPKNKREHLCSITIKGHKIYEAAEQIINKYNQSVIKLIPEKDINELHTTLSKISRAARI